MEEKRSYLAWNSTRTAGQVQWPTRHISYQTNYLSQLSDNNTPQSSVATYLRCVGIFNDHLLQIHWCASKKLRKLVHIWGSYRQKYGVSLFLTHTVHTQQHTISQFLLNVSF